MVKTILKYPNRILTTVCEPVTRFDDSIDKLAGDLLDTLRASGRKGVGLSAPQIGDLCRMFVIDLPGGRMPFNVFVNPVIRKRRGEVTDIEGCLSLEPKDDCKVTRAKIISWSAQTVTGLHISGKLHDFEARVFQHELDHLDGICILDRKMK